ncbi:MAG TPA: branched-chain amino acid ABC transporter permease [Stellaceae bacterium]|nr:branched-chain amino acid ABC transporter permease [Stellaceae bacterium]
MTVDRTIAGLCIVAVALAAGGFFVPAWMVFIGVISLAKGLVVLGLVVLWRTGLVSFGQSLYYALGAYAVGLAHLYWGMTDAFVAVILGMAVAGFVAFVIGFLLARYRDLFFAMLSLAFAMILYGVLVKSEALGSTDGFVISVPTFAGFAPGADAAQAALLAFTAAIVLASAYLTDRYQKSTAGHLTTAIRDNEIRVEYLGFSVRRAIHVKYVLAGILGGAGGALVAMAVGHIDPDMAYWTTAGEFVFVAILSGTASVAAPFFGSIIFEVLRSYAMQYAAHFWHMVLGVALLLIIMFLPDGLWSLFRKRARAH